MLDAERAPCDCVLDRVVPMAVAGFLFAAVDEFQSVDGGTRVRAIARHGSAEDPAVHAELGSEAGWGGARDQRIALVA